MRVCERCGQTFDDGRARCPDDGADLAVSNDSLVGRTVGSYVLVKRLGRGGAGVVYRAVHPLIRSEVAIKLLKELPEENPDALARFVREARAVNQIHHPNIVRISDFGTTTDGRAYIVMELLEGASLRERMEHGPPLGVDEARTLVLQVVDALGAAHAAGFVHRDLKPDNIFVTRDGQAKLLDFGVAKLLGQVDVSRLTGEGAIVGTPMYLAPEQARGTLDEIGPATDLYSLGVVLYEMYTGRAPFEAQSVSGILLAHLETAPTSPRSHNPAIPAELGKLILQCLEKQPAARPASANDLGDAFRRASDEGAPGLAKTLPGGTLPQLVHRSVSATAAASARQPEGSSPRLTSSVALAAGDHDLMLYAWTPDYPDPEDVYFLLARQGREAGLNYAHFADEQFDALVDLARTEPRAEERTRRWGQVEARVRDQRPWLPLLSMTGFVAVRRDLKGARFHFEGTHGILTSLAKARFGR